MKTYLIAALCLILYSCDEQKSDFSNSEILGPEIVSTIAPEFATTINSDLTQIYFNRASEDRSSMQIMFSTFENNEWSVARPLEFSTGEFRDVDPFLNTVDNRLYFSSNRPLDKNSEAGVYNTWFVENNKDGWSEPIIAEKPLNSDSTEIFITMSKNGNAYFVSERGEKRIIMASKYKNGHFQEPQNIELKLRGVPIYASNPCIASDESFLIVAARDPMGSGAPDLFVTFSREGKWSELINLGLKVNSEYAEFAPGLSKNDEVLFYSSERPGIVGKQNEGIRPPGDIYQVNLKNVLSSLEKQIVNQ